MANKKILIIDDDKVLTLLLSRKLSEAGYEVVNAFDGVQGLRLAFHEKPDLILLDIRFPAGGGINTLEKLSSSTKTWNIPIIIITGYDEPEIKQQISGYNVIEYMIKPIEPQSLIDKIREVIGE